MAYTLISSQILLNPTATITFSGIPQNYKDLVLEVVAASSTAGNSIAFTVNGDTATNYSETRMYGDGATTGSGRNSNLTLSSLNSAIGVSTVAGEYLANLSIFSYSNTSIFKAILGRANRASANNFPGTAMNVTLWRSTTAVTSITLSNAANHMLSTGSTFKLWGIS